MIQFDRAGEFRLSYPVEFTNLFKLDLEVPGQRCWFWKLGLRLWDGWIVVVG